MGEAIVLDFGTIRLLHQSAVTVSVSGFVVRAAAAARGATWIRRRPVRMAAQLVDSALLALGLSLAWMLRLNPLTTSWLLAKLIALVCYVGLGMLALRPGRPAAVRGIAGLAALACVAYIIGVAISKDPGWPLHRLDVG